MAKWPNIDRRVRYWSAEVGGLERSPQITDARWIVLALTLNAYVTIEDPNVRVVAPSTGMMWSAKHPPEQVEACEQCARLMHPRGPGRSSRPWLCMECAQSSPTAMLTREQREQLIMTMACEYAAHY